MQMALPNNGRLNSALPTPPSIVVHDSPLTLRSIQTLVSNGYPNVPYTSSMPLSTQTNISAHEAPETLTFNEQTVLDPHLANNPNTFFQEPRPATQTPQNNENPISATNAGEVAEYSGENSENSLRTLSFMASVKREPTDEENLPSAKRLKK
jgi:hypothetical protein